MFLKCDTLFHEVLLDGRLIVHRLQELVLVVRHDQDEVRLLVPTARGRKGFAHKGKPGKDNLDWADHDEYTL